MFRGGEPNGQGVATYANGDHYEGEFRDGRQNGHGVFTFANGNRYDGEWRNDKLNGRSDDGGDTISLKNQLSEASWFRVSHRIIKRKYVAMHFCASGLHAFW